MRTKRIIGAAVLLLTSTWCLQVRPSSLATDGLRQISPDQLPRFGTFWVAGKAGGQLQAPLPCLPPDDTAYPIFDLGGGSYLIAKDPAALNSPQVTQLLSDVAQAQEAAANSLTTSSINRSNPLDGPIPDGPDPLGPDVFHVETLTLSNGFLVFNIEGLTPGDTYLLCRKTVLDDTFTNYWVPQRQFTAGASNRVASIPLPNDSSIGFYLVMDYDLYQGPAPTIVTPADNSTVSGIIQVKASLTDILPATQATLYVDGNNFGTITNGPATWNLDTARMANGSHTIEARFLSWYYTTDDLGSNSVAPWYSSAVLYSLNTMNSLAENTTPRGGFTSGLGVMSLAFDTSMPATVNVSIYDSTGTNLVWSITGTNDVPGTFYTYWNLLDNSGNPVPLPATDQVVTYNVTATATPTGPSSPSSTRSFPVHVGTDPHAGHTATFYNRFNALQDALGRNAQMDYLVAGVAGAVQLAHTLHPSDYDGWDRAMNQNAMPWIFGQDTDFPYFYNVITNQATGHLVYLCHASTYTFGAGTWNTASYQFSFVNVANTVGNDLNDYGATHPIPGKYHHRVWVAEIDGCNSATGPGNYAFGSPDGLDQQQMTKSAYVGWTAYLINFPYWLPSSSPDKQIQYWHSFWTDMGQDSGIVIRTAGNQCFDAFGADAVWKTWWKVQGSQQVTWWKKD